MLRQILTVAGKPGLYRLVSRGNRNLIVESLDASHKRMPVFATDRVVSLGEIAMYTDEEEVPLSQVMKNIYDKEGGKPTAFDFRKASKDELAEFMATALPNYDRDRVYPSDMKRLAQWYNLLVENGISFEEETAGETAE
ncbi:MAG: DUF5606 domain-containing protein [Bacteroidaceae bacterium]|nr:DUF5606 domain-containing protein [Bacteroidaceae bacterium]